MTDRKDNMTTSNSTDTSHRTTRIIQALGVCIFAVSFFLPACRDMKTGAIGRAGIMRGYECAVDALTWGFAYLWHLHPIGPLLLLSDLINLLVPAYLFFSFATDRKVARRRIAMFTLACMVATWSSLVFFKLVPLVGHFLWIAGALLVIVPQWIADRRAPQKSNSVA
jgi:hypothetical protein